MTIQDCINYRIEKSSFKHLTIYMFNSKNNKFKDLALYMTFYDLGGIDIDVYNYTCSNVSSLLNKSYFDKNGFLENNNIKNK